MALSEIELMNKYHNRYFLAFISVMNRLKPMETISSIAFAERIKKIADETSPYRDEWIDEFVQHACDNGFFASKKGSIQKTMTESIFLPMAMPEKIYLKNILKSPYAALFLDEPVIEELLKNLSDVPDMMFDKLIDFTGIEPDPIFDDTYIKNFRLLMQAIQEHQKITFINIDAQGNKRYNFERIPFRMEYSVIMRCFWLILWNQKEERAFKANIFRISDIQLMGKIPDIEYQNMMNKMEQQKEQHPIIMTVTDEKNAVERISLLLSVYHKEMEYICENKVKISVNYYNFDENEIIDGIMSFGKLVCVHSPEHVVKKIKAKLIAEFCLPSNGFA